MKSFRVFHRPRHSFLPGKLWIIICAILTAAGWLLSAVNMLNTSGYLLVLLGLLAGGVYSLRSVPLQPIPWKKWKRRFRRPLPALFLTVATLIFLSGLLYLPNNYDALTYRIPRLFHWFSAEHWHWIRSTLDARFNVLPPCQEWLFAPILLLTGGSTRFLFLINFIAYLLSPSLLFGTFRQLEVAPRVAWCWMWILPAAGFCYLLQAGGIGNDSYALVFLLASIYYPLRARQTGAVSDLWIGALGAALMSAAKITNTPLALCFLIAAWPSRHLLWQRKVGTTGVLAVCLLASFLPQVVMNHRHQGDWFGLTAFPPDAPHHVTNPLMGLAGNSIQLTIANTVPPILPGYQKLEEKATRLFEKPVEAIQKHFPRFQMRFRQMQSEESAGLGSPLTALLLVSLLAGLACRKPVERPVSRIGFLISLVAWGCLVLVMIKVSSGATSRLIAVYYPLCILPLLLLPANSVLVRNKLWKGLAAACILIAIPLLVVQPARPLWPALTVLDKLAAKYPNNRFLQQLETTYSVYRQRGAVFAPLVPYLPEERNLAIISSGDVNITSLWLPLGKRVIHEISADNEAEIRTHHPFKTCLILEGGVERYYRQSTHEWIAARGGEILVEREFHLKASQPPVKSYLVKLP